MRSRSRKAEAREQPGFPSEGEGEEFSGIVEKIVPGGEGLVRNAGQVIFVPFTIPGERVRVRIVYRGKGYLRGELMEVLEASPDRHSPPCPLFTRCGGCNLQQMTYERQLSVRQEIVMDAFERTAKVKIGRPEIVPSDELYYRNRVQIHRRTDGKIGFMRRDSNEIIEVGHCYISLPPVNRLFAAPPEAMPSRFNAFAWRDSLWTDAGTNGDSPLAVDICGKEVRFSLNGFFQSNVGMLEKLIPRFLAAAEAAAGGRRTVVDLYAGSGLFGSFLADRFESVVSVEQNPAGIAFARQNVRGPGHEFHTRDVDHWVSGQLSKGTKAVKPDLVVADPPRTGLSPRVKEYLIGSGVPAFLYVSCDPVTLARDSATLLSGGFVLDSLTLFDFYPQTSHIESFAVFRRA